MEERLGPRAETINPIVGTIFPNFSILKASTRCFRVWHPKGPDHIEIWSWVFTDRARAARGSRKPSAWSLSVPSVLPAPWNRTTSTTGRECTRSSRGLVYRRYMLNYQMGLGPR